MKDNIIKYIDNAGILRIVNHTRNIIQEFKVKDMTNPVVCGHCGETYDLSKVRVTTRYKDCDEWKAPCCKAIVDNRPAAIFKTKPDFTKIDLTGVVRIAF